MELVEIGAWHEGEVNKLKEKRAVASKYSLQSELAGVIWFEDRETLAQVFEKTAKEGEEQNDEIYFRTVLTNPDILIDLKKDWEKFKASLDKPAGEDENKSRLEFCQNYLRISVDQRKIKSISKELISAAMEKKFIYP